jgi:hypothetical protein
MQNCEAMRCHAISAATAKSSFIWARKTYFLHVVLIATGAVISLVVVIINPRVPLRTGVKRSCDTGVSVQRGEPSLLEDIQQKGSTGLL